MKLTTYSIFVGILLGLISCLVYLKIFGSNIPGESIVQPLIIFELLSVFLCVVSAWLYLKNFSSKRVTVRPLIYWPTITLMSAIFTKSVDGFLIVGWIIAGVTIGTIAEWRSRKNKTNKST